MSPQYDLCRHDGTPISPDEVTFPAMLQDARRRLGLTLTELAERSGVSAGQLSRLESGQTSRPNERTLNAIATALGRSISSLAYIAYDLGDYDEEMRGEDFELYEQVTEDAEPGTEEMRRALRAFAWKSFTEGQIRQALTQLVGVEHSVELEELATRWLGLSDERRAKVLDYTQEQEQLSAIDRRAARSRDSQETGR